MNHRRILITKQNTYNIFFIEIGQQLAEDNIKHVIPINKNETYLLHIILILIHKHIDTLFNEKKNVYRCSANFKIFINDTAINIDNVRYC